MQADTFLRTSGARNPTVIVKIFIFIFLWLKWYCRINYAREGGAIWRVGPDACKYLIHKKLHISACRGSYNLGQCVFAYNSHTVCHTLRKKNKWKTYFFELLLRILDLI